MNRHTKEPWRHQRYKNELSLVVSCADASRIIAEAKFEDDARRLVACVNACKHYSTEDLEEVGEHLSGVLADTRKRCAELIAQRDQLLSSLANLLKSCGGTCLCGRNESCSVCSRSGAQSIAEVEAKELIARIVQP